MDKTFAAFGAIFGLLGVAAGAFGAHALHNRLSPGDLAIFETGVRYQMYHALALFASAWATQRFGGWLPQAAGWLFVNGIVIFSGTLYIISLAGVRWFGAIAPLGGLSLMLGWLALAIAVLRDK